MDNGTGVPRTKDLQAELSMIQEVYHENLFKRNSMLKHYVHSISIEALLIIILPQSSFLSIEEWINKMWLVDMIEYYSAIKNKGIMKFQSNGWN